MSSYDANYKYAERGSLEFYVPPYQPPKRGEGGEPMEMDQAAYGGSMIEQWPTSPNDTSIPAASAMFPTFLPQYSANEGVSYNAYQVSSEGDMFPGISVSQGNAQPGLQLDRPQIDEQLRLQRLPAYSNQLSVSQSVPKPQERRTTRSSSAAQAVQPLPPAAASLAQKVPDPASTTTSPPGSSPPPKTSTVEPPQPNPTAPSESASRRQAHNLVERKYRDTLNGELVRLRQAIPHIRDLDAETPEGRSRASKATVLAAAADYIARLVGEIEGLAEENAALRRRAGLGPAPPLGADGAEEGGGGTGGRGRGRRARGRRAV
jgi:hypothetical protein